jgi:flavin reductase (DIM6/NTAB) family NADH-FMN oxidoreductase RutF
MQLQTIDLPRCYRLLNHGPVVLLSTSDGTRTNACAVAWIMPAELDPPRFAAVLDHASKTYANTRVAPECVINVPTVDALAEVLVCGTRSGHDGDKLAAAHIATVPSSTVRPARLECAAAWIEARVIGEPAAADTSVLLLEALFAEARPGVIDGDGLWDVLRHPTLHHLGSYRFAVPGSVRTA